MKWREFLEQRKKYLLIVLLAILLILCIILLRSCGLFGSKGAPDSTVPVVYENGEYVPTVTYLIRMYETDEEPSSIVLEVNPNGKACIPPHIVDMEDVIWSGWLTEDGEPFDFDTVLTEDIELYCIYWDDLNNNDIIDGSASDPITVYEFQHNGYVLTTKTFFGQDVKLDLSLPEYTFPQSEDDGYVFLRWNESKSVNDDGGKTTIVLAAELGLDRNNNDLLDGSDEDPYVYHVFLAQDGSVLEEIRWLTGEDEVQTDSVACPTTSKQKLVGWIRSESTDEEGNLVYTYTPEIIEQ